MKTKIIILIMIFACNSQAQIKKTVFNVVLPAISYSIFSGLEEGYRIVDRNCAINGNYNETFNQRWHDFKMCRQTTALILGVGIAYNSKGDWKTVAKNLILVGAIHWIVHDIFYNLIVYPEKSIFYQSKNSTSRFEKFGSFKIITISISFAIQ